MYMLHKGNLKTRR